MPWCPGGSTLTLICGALTDTRTFCVCTATRCLSELDPVPIWRLVSPSCRPRSPVEDISNAMDLWAITRLGRVESSYIRLIRINRFYVGCLHSLRIRLYEKRLGSKREQCLEYLLGLTYPSTVDSAVGAPVGVVGAALNYHRLPLVAWRLHAAWGGSRRAH